MRVRSGLALLALASLLAAPAAHAGSTAQKLAHRGPSTLAVGLAFTVLSPFKLAWDAATGGRPKLQACRFGHGVKMLVGGAVLLPTGLLVSPFQAEGLPDAWMDGVVEAYQEDYCSRPIGAILP
jgi:hypothetical protein